MADKMYDNLLEWGIATEEELALVSSIMGHNVGTYEAVLFSRTGYRSWESLEDGGMVYRISLEEEES